jgi:hypothetical protein
MCPSGQRTLAAHVPEIPPTQAAFSANMFQLGGIAAPLRRFVPMRGR